MKALVRWRDSNDDWNWSRQLNKDCLHGWLVIDKPLGMTSRAVVDHAARWFPRKTSIGHAGTLDPLATGVLVIAVGKATRLIEYVQEMAKTYTASFTLGATSATDDAEGPIEKVAGATDPGRTIVDAALVKFVGNIGQTPPAYSAAKVAGQRAYARARAGSPVLPTAKTVRIDAIDVLDYAFPRLRVQVRCGKGTYIRSIARDLGQALGIGGYVSELRRDTIGDFTNQDATALDSPDARLYPLERGVTALPSCQLSDEQLRRLCLGQTISDAGLDFGLPIACFDGRGNLAAIASSPQPGWLKPVKVLG